MPTSPIQTNEGRPLSRRDFARLAAASLSVAAAPPQAAVLGELAPSLAVVDEEVLRASAVFTMSF